MATLLALTSIVLGVAQPILVPLVAAAKGRAWALWLLGTVLWMIIAAPAWLPLLYAPLLGLTAESAALLYLLVLAPTVAVLCCPGRRKAKRKRRKRVISGALQPSRR